MATVGRPTGGLESLLKRSAAPAPGVDDPKGGTRRSSSRGGKKEWSAADLNEQQKSIGQGFVDDGVLESLDAYAADLGAVGGLGGNR